MAEDTGSPLWKRPRDGHRLTAVGRGQGDGRRGHRREQDRGSTCIRGGGRPAASSQESQLPGDWVGCDPPPSGSSVCGDPTAAIPRPRLRHWARIRHAGSSTAVNSLLSCSIVHVNAPPHPCGSPTQNRRPRGRHAAVAWQNPRGLAHYGVVPVRPSSGPPRDDCDRLLRIRLPGG